MKNRVKNIQAVGYNGARTIVEFLVKIQVFNIISSSPVVNVMYKNSYKFFNQSDTDIFLHKQSERVYLF